MDVRGNIFDNLPEDAGPEIKPRKWWIAALISLPLAGLGHFYCGKPWRGLFFYLLLIAVNASCLYVMLDKPSGMTAIFWPIALLMYVAALLLDAAGTALRAGESYRLKRYNKSYIYIIVFLVTAVPINTLAYTSIGVFMGGAYNVTDDTLKPTLLDGDIALFQSVLFRDGIERGDLVVFAGEGLMERAHASRVVGLPGEVIEMRGGRVYINGRKLMESGIPPDTEGLSDFGPEEVGKDEYYVIGDNRLVKQDAPSLGLVPSEKVYGRIVTILSGMDDPETGRDAWQRSGIRVEKVRYGMY